MDNTPAESHDIAPKASHAVSEEEATALHAPFNTTDEATPDALLPVRALASPALEGWHALGTALLYLVFFRVSTFLPFSVTSTIFVTLVAMVLMLVFTVRVARALQTPRALAVNFLLTALFALPLVSIPILRVTLPTWGGWQQVMPLFIRYFDLLRHVLGLKELLVIWLAVCIGAGISRIIKEMKLLLPAGVVLGLVDLLAVFSSAGVVHKAVTSQSSIAQVAMSALTVKLPSTHATGGSAPLELRVGFADFLFIALFFACFKRFGISAWSTFVALCGVLSVYMLIVAYADVALPALVPIGVVVIGMNLRHFRYDRSEWFALLYAGILVAVIGGLFWFMGHR